MFRLTMKEIALAAALLAVVALGSAVRQFRSKAAAPAPPEALLPS